MTSLKMGAFWIATSLLLASTDPFVGVWRLDSDKSKFTIGDPSFMFAAMQIESVGRSLKSIASAANGEGLASSFTFSCSLDGRPCDVIAATPMRGATAIDQISLRRVNERTIAATGMKNGRTVYTDQRIVSADGKTMKVTRKGITPQGRVYESIIVLVRTR